MSISTIISSYVPGLAVSGIVATIIKSKSIFISCIRIVAIIGDMASSLYYRLTGQAAITKGESDVNLLAETVSQIETVVSHDAPNGETL